MNVEQPVAGDRLLQEICDCKKFVVLYMIALGTGGIKPCVSSYGADQLDCDDEAEKEQKSSFFNWFYFSINNGALIASSVLVYAQDNRGCGWGFGIPAVAMTITSSKFLFRYSIVFKPKIWRQPSHTSLSGGVMASIRKYRVKVPADKSLLYEKADVESNVSGSRKLDQTKDFTFASS